MNVDHLLDHLTENSTVRGIVWTLGSVSALWAFWHDQWETGAQIFATAGMVAGGLGMLTSDHKQRDADE
jgi:hypothetical protein